MLNVNLEQFLKDNYPHILTNDNSISNYNIYCVNITLKHSIDVKYPPKCDITIRCGLSHLNICGYEFYIFCRSLNVMYVFEY